MGKELTPEEMKAKKEKERKERIVKQKADKEAKLSESKNQEDPEASEQSENVETESASAPAQEQTTTLSKLKEELSQQEEEIKRKREELAEKRRAIKDRAHEAVADRKKASIKKNILAAIVARMESVNANITKAELFITLGEENEKALTVQARCVHGEKKVSLNLPFNSVDLMKQAVDFYKEELQELEKSTENIDQLVEEAWIKHNQPKPEPVDPAQTKIVDQIEEIKAEKEAEEAGKGTPVEAEPEEGDDDPKF